MSQAPLILHRAKLLVVVSALCAAGRAQTIPPTAPPVADTVLTLPQFSVTANSANAYSATEVESVARTASSLVDTPMSVDVITPGMLQDTGAQSIYDVSRYLPGVTPGRGSGDAGIQDRQDFRGFENFSKTIDNFSSFEIPTGSGTTAVFDPAFVQSAEIVMGPDAILSPTGAPGGSLNVITKSPQFTADNRVDLEFGNENAQKLIVDSTGPIGDGQHWAYRVIASGQDTQEYVPGRLIQTNGSAQLEYVISPTAKITFKYFGEHFRATGNVATITGEVAYAPYLVGGATLPNTPLPGFSYDGTDGAAPWSYRFERFDMINTELTAAIGNHINMRLGASVTYEAQGYDAAVPKSAPAETFNPATGQVTGLSAWDPSNVAIAGSYFHYTSRQLQLQNDYAASYELGPVSVKPVAGWSSQLGTTRNYSLTDPSAADLPNANLYAGTYDPPAPPLADYTGFTSNYPETASLFQLYGVMRVGFFRDHVFLMGGASRTWATVNDYSFKGAYLPGIGQVGAAPGTANYLQDFTFSNTGNAVAPTQKDYHDAYLGGVLVKLTDYLSLYGSYSSNAGIAASNPLWQAGSQYEFGAKAQFFHQRLTLTADHFQITQTNVSAQNPLYNVGLSPFPTILSDQTNHGEEFSAAGGITSNLSVIASVTDMKLRDTFGRRLRNVPDSIENLLLNYRFTDSVLQNASVFAAVEHEGNVAGETQSGLTALGVPEQPGFYLAAWTVVNAGAGYTLGRYHFNLNVDNALNAKFWWAPFSRTAVNPYPGLTVRLTTAVHF